MVGEAVEAVVLVVGDGGGGGDGAVIVARGEVEGQDVGEGEAEPFLKEGFLDVEPEHIDLVLLLSLRPCVVVDAEVVGTGDVEVGLLPVVFGHAVAKPVAYCVPVFAVSALGIAVVYIGGEGEAAHVLLVVEAEPEVLVVCVLRGRGGVVSRGAVLQRALAQLRDAGEYAGLKPVLCLYGEPLAEVVTQVEVVGDGRAQHRVAAHPLQGVGELAVGGHLVDVRIAHAALEVRPQPAFLACFLVEAEACVVREIVVALPHAACVVQYEGCRAVDAGGGADAVGRVEP